MEAGGGRLPYVRAIDGLRGASVLAVLAFHGGTPIARGGFLGVSVFFTLSGYLITQLLLSEHERAGKISLRRFWGRRARRLAPASLAALTAICLLTRFTDLFPGTAVPGDLAAAATNVANWRFAVASTSYQDLFSAGPSPVLHFWSLAIEEQFYLLFPLLVTVLLARGSRARLAGTLIALTVLGTAVALTASRNVAYYGTPARAPELLVGALLALAVPIDRPLRARPARAVALGGGAAAIALVALAARTPVDSAWLYRGGLPAVAVLSAAVVAATTVPGRVRRATSISPLVAVGRLSYGIYVYHWPIFLLLREDRVGVGGPPLFALRCLATGAVALVSSRILEDPVRRGRLLRRAPLGAGVLTGALGTILALALLAAPTGAPPLVPVDAALASTHVEAAQPALEVLVVGSVPALADWVRDARVPDQRLRVRTARHLGCRARTQGPGHGACGPSAHRARDLPARRPDLVVVGLGPADRAPMADALRRAAPGSPDIVGATEEALAISRRVLDDLLADLGGTPALVVDTTPGDPLNSELRQLDMRSVDLTASEARDPVALARDLVAVVSTLRDDTRLRVLVIGDSSSYQLATALDAAGSTTMSVAWAGRAGCALVPAERLRWARDIELDGRSCPSTSDQWPTAVHRFRPDVILAAASLGELSDHRYSGSRAWAAPGTPAYGRVHEAWMEQLQELAGPTGALTVVATTPPLAHGKLYDGPIGSPARARAWRDQIRRWEGAWASVAVVDWAAIVRRAESAAGHDLRDDAVHFARDPLVSELAPRLVDALGPVITQLDATARARGCLVDLGTRRHLVLDACRRGG